MASTILLNTREKEVIQQKLNDCLFGQERDEVLNVDLLAKLMHMSRPTLYRKMKTITDRTPNELINEARLNRAAELLAGGEYRVFEVARMVGYTSQSSFGKSFLKQFKVTPATYRRMNKLVIAKVNG
ncbi:helix-turn-helix transcriptional regulator [Paraflavitalea speifideaquila]|uniref:helix-turn-helix domain-containing protein n=1 Tax=Paraflavitalea speifideaquila TaxID=3076558 RepID=UPI0028E86FE3|nr:helix-turn-helix transcriptional regulator [Paraflavitalea speifideiaquila]